MIEIKLSTDMEQMYYIIDERGRYYCYNDFNGKAAMLLPNDLGEPPAIAATMNKEIAESKIFYLMERTNNKKNTPENKRKGFYYNDFCSLTLKKI